MEEILGTVPTKIAPEMNEGLLKSFEGKEVKDGLFRCSRHISFNGIGSFVEKK
jgi:hypothetical protein